MKITEPTKVRHRKTGLIYKLIPKPEIYRMAYLLTPNDGLVPSSQVIIRTDEELDEMFIEMTT